MTTSGPSSSINLQRRAHDGNGQTQRVRVVGTSRCLPFILSSLPSLFFWPLPAMPTKSITDALHQAIEAALALVAALT